MVLQIKTQQNQPAQTQPTKSPRETELEEQIKLYEQEMQKLVDKNYIANIKDDAFFRIELLASLNQIANVFRNFLEEIKQSQQGEQS